MNWRGDNIDVLCILCIYTVSIYTAMRLFELYILYVVCLIASCGSQLVVWTSPSSQCRSLWVGNITSTTVTKEKLTKLFQRYVGHTTMSVSPLLWTIVCEWCTLWIGTVTVLQVWQIGVYSPASWSLLCLCELWTARVRRTGFEGATGEIAIPAQAHTWLHTHISGSSFWVWFLTCIISPIWHGVPSWK